ncbi:cbb3-type cytochrome oxidase assembly protein CcoS [Balneolaceae bacterium ANBcel3]|nr:cbb3-type cytochrome oxidase assembly protein CcoS [Balneolaceae bacterium ANBcel3]
MFLQIDTYLNRYTVMGAGAWILIISSLLIIVGGLVLFLWAFRNGQFDQIRKNSMLPFDEDEPPGERTDQIFKPEKDQQE